ncbi:MAG: phosphoglycolate phosphatase [Proteobacteria bacterium]|nr:phosphoglycolate phosphatase [Pseudomonadota bacterium]HQR02984.1 phosphoglycolate phosphatase [Rhodocyclaceae bacterium]
MPEALLFDLDGTLADTAPDLAGAINRLLLEEGRPTFPPASLRPYASQGARGLLGAGFAITPDHADYPRLSARFLTLYEQNLCNETTLFPGMAAVLDHLATVGLAWGIVTNKSERFTHPLLASLGLDRRAACVVCGDTAARPKPHPDPLLLACKELGVTPSRSFYLGDDERDIQAGKAAGMGTVAVTWGYLNGPAVEAWGADKIIDTPAQILDLLT